MGRFRCENSRRLTGANLYSHYPGAVLDLLIRNECSPGDKSDQNKINLNLIVDVWAKYVRSLMDAVSWSSETSFHRYYAGGVSLGITAPIDVLYSAVELVESALMLSAEELRLGPISELETQSLPENEALVSHLQEIIEEEARPALLNLQAAADSHNTLFLYDDDIVSVGSGAGCRQWSPDQIPDPMQIRWDELATVPLALITGTNGKSTSVRLATSIAQAAGLIVGSTSTDYIKVGDVVVDKGDYSGPGGARTLMRDERIDIAFLELARGGLLRRGLGVPEADAVLITNIAADHLGDYGINTVPELIEAKFIVRKALTATKPLILNADDAGIVKHVQDFDQNIVWFSQDKNNKVLIEHVDKGGEVITIEAQKIVHIKDGQSTAIVQISEIPITLNGLACHNVQNALGVVALCCVLEIEYTYIEQGLLDFSGSAKENPGRGNFFAAHGVKILIDFAHNEHAMKALARTAVNMPSARRLILMGQAGDRSDEAIVDLVNAAMMAKPDKMIVSETPGYERGRDFNEISDIIIAAIKATGFSETDIERASEPAEGVRMALDWAKPDDFLLFFILTNRDEVIEIVQEYISG